MSTTDYLWSISINTYYAFCEIRFRLPSTKHLQHLDFIIIASWRQADCHTVDSSTTCCWHLKYRSNMSNLTHPLIKYSKFPTILLSYSSYRFQSNFFCYHCKYVVRCLNGWRFSWLQSAVVRRCIDIHNKLVAWLTGCHRLVSGTHKIRHQIAHAWLLVNLGHEQCDTCLKVVAINSENTAEDYTSTPWEKSLNSSERD